MTIAANDTAAYTQYLQHHKKLFFDSNSTKTFTN